MEVSADHEHATKVKRTKQGHKQRSGLKRSIVGNINIGTTERRNGRVRLMGIYNVTVGHKGDKTLLHRKVATIITRHALSLTDITL